MAGAKDQHDGPGPSIADCGYLSDCHAAALVARDGTIVWCAMPRIDSASCFAALLDPRKGGFLALKPTGAFDTTRRYEGPSLVLETTFRTDEGEARLLDFFAMRRGGRHAPYRQLLRVVEGVRGEVELELDARPRFDYGAVAPWVRAAEDDSYFCLMGGSSGLLVSGDLPLERHERHALRGKAVVREGERLRLAIEHRRPEELDRGVARPSTSEEIDERLEETRDWWRAWSDQGDHDLVSDEHTRRSAVVLKGLTNAPTGAMAAAATTSLPEVLGGSRNWDYRFTWIRDSVFAMRALGQLGYEKEADGFSRFVTRSAAGSAREVQVLFGVGGERRLPEHEVPELSGYRGSSPVRIGNAAETQRQHDVYGELLDLAWRRHERGASPDDEYWAFLCDLVEEARKCWRLADHGIWEVRGERRHFVHSKAMCWTAFDRGVRLAEALGRDGPVDAWKQECAAIREAIEDEGYDADRGVFVQTLGGEAMDAALLLLPVFGFVGYDDPRMVRTTDAIREELEEDGLLRRYGAGSDQLDGLEGSFIACTFWLAEVLARQGRLDEAREVYARALATANDLGLFSEEVDLASGAMLGNFPQGLTHLSQIAAAVALAG